MKIIMTLLPKVRRQSPTGDYIVEMAIVNDNRQVSIHTLSLLLDMRGLLRELEDNITCLRFTSQFIHHGRDLSATVKNAIDIVNAADAVGVHSA